MTFQPGQSGNPGGRSTNKDWAAALRIAVARAHGQSGTKLQALADKTVDEGLAGNMNAIKEIGDRIDGKVPQGVQNEDPDKPFRIENTFRWLSPDESSDEKS